MNVNISIVITYGFKKVHDQFQTKRATNLMTFGITFSFYFKEEYQLCYSAVAEYLQNDSVYANA